MTSSFRGVLTVSRMRVGVDEAGVEYLLGERSDQLIGGLQSEHSMRRFSDPPHPPSECQRPCRVHQLTSFKLNPCLLISSTSLILHPLQNSAVNTLFGLGREKKL